MQYLPQQQLHLIRCQLTSAAHSKQTLQTEKATAAGACKLRQVAYAAHAEPEDGS